MSALRQTQFNFTESKYSQKFTISTDEISQIQEKGLTSQNTEKQINAVIKMSQKIIDEYNKGNAIIVPGFSLEDTKNFIQTLKEYNEKLKTMIENKEKTTGTSAIKVLAGIGLIITLAFGAYLGIEELNKDKDGNNQKASLLDIFNSESSALDLSNLPSDKLLFKLDEEGNIQSDRFASTIERSGINDNADHKKFFEKVLEYKNFTDLQKNGILLQYIFIEYANGPSDLAGKYFADVDFTTMSYLDHELATIILTMMKDKKVITFDDAKAKLNEQKQIDPRLGTRETTGTHNTAVKDTTTFNAFASNADDNVADAEERLKNAQKELEDQITEEKKDRDIIIANAKKIIALGKDPTAVKGWAKVAKDLNITAKDLE